MTEWDQSLFLWLNLSPQAPHTMLSVARFFGRHLQSYLVATTLAVALFGRTPWRGQAVRALLAIAVAAAAVGALKYGLTFPRPAALGLGTQWIENSRATGLPSGHSTIAAAWATAAMLTAGSKPWQRLAFGLTALLVGWSRIALGSHFPLDVLAGWALGMLCALVVQRATQRLRIN